MAAVHGKNSRVYVGGYDLTSYLRKVTASGEVDVAETTTFGKSSKTKIAGQKDGKISAEALFSFSNAAGAGDIDNVLAAALGSDEVPWLYGPEGDAFGKRAVGMLATLNSYEVETPVDGVVSVKAEAEQSTSGYEGGVFLVSGASAQSAGGNSTNVDNTVSSAAGLSAYLEVPDVVGASPSLAVKIQHSVDNSAWVDLVSFAAVTADYNAQRVTVATGVTINRHLRALWTFGGTMTAATFAVAVCRK